MRPLNVNMPLPSQFNVQDVQPIESIICLCLPVTSYIPYLDVLLIEWVEIVVVRQLIALLEPSIACEKRHMRAAANGPFLHSAIRLAGVVCISSNGTASTVDDHALAHKHEIAAL